MGRPVPVAQYRWRISLFLSRAVPIRDQNGQVDDNADAADSLAALLRSQGHVVTIRHNAHGALEEARRLRPDAVILDIGLPDMDGYELCRRLQGMPETRGAAYIALTGYGQAHGRVLAKAAGFEHYFVKPVDMTASQRVLAEVAPTVHAS